MAKRHTDTHEIACRQVLREDCSVSSIQWLTIPASHAGAVTPELLLKRYLAHVRRFTLSLVRPFLSVARIEFRLLATRLSLLSFGAPTFAEGRDASSVTLPISGGCLAQRGERGRGEISFFTEMVGEEMKVVVQLAGYHPRLLGSGRPPCWRKLLYRLTQARLHRAVTVGFLARLSRELEGGRRRIRVVTGEGPAGEEI